MSERQPRDAEQPDAQQVLVEAIGEPGQRRFRLIAVIGGDTAIVWMEKTQLDALSRALEQILDQLPDAGPEERITQFDIIADLNTRRQFRAGRMELGFDEANDRIIMIAHKIESESLDEPGVICRMTRSQARDLSEDAARVVAAGRPRCVLCGLPFTTGQHACPKQNGHFPEELEEMVRDDG
jgi:uncharacterized repeat protein (TIGR03847 family)